MQQSRHVLKYRKKQVFIAPLPSWEEEIELQNNTFNLISLAFWQGLKSVTQANHISCGSKKHDRGSCSYIRIFQNEMHMISTNCHLKCGQCTQCCWVLSSSQAVWHVTDRSLYICMVGFYSPLNEESLLQLRGIPRGWWFNLTSLHLF